MHNKASHSDSFSVAATPPLQDCACWQRYETHMKDWSELQFQFEPDGSLRDIYIEDVDESVWDRFLSNLQSSNFKFGFSHGQKKLGLPESFAEIKELQETDPTTLAIVLGGGILIHCHFFTNEEIELDVSPKDIDGQEKLEILIGFMHWLSLSLNRQVKLTHENSQDDVIFSVKA